jgi:hypothetical protein
MNFTTPVAQLPLTVGQQLTFAGDPNPWTMKAVTEHFAAATRPHVEHTACIEFATYPCGEEGDVLYTVLDWRNGVRGPCNLSGQGWGDGTYTEAECAQMLAEFEAGELEVSHRNQVRIEFAEVAW